MKSDKFVKSTSCLLVQILSSVNLLIGKILNPFQSIMMEEDVSMMFV